MRTRDPSRWLARSILLTGMLAVVAEPAMALCGDGVVGFGEACDDGNAVRGDGCSATCTFEPLCLVGRAAGSLELGRIGTGGSLEAVTSLPVASSASAVRLTASCGRFVYWTDPVFDRLRGFEVATDGAVSSLSDTAVTPEPQGIVCDEIAGRALSWSVGGLSSTLRSYAVGADGALTELDFEFLTLTGGRTPRADLDASTGDVILTQAARVSFLRLTQLSRVTIAPDGLLARTGNGDALGTDLLLRDLRVSPDGGFLALPDEFRGLIHLVGLAGGLPPWSERVTTDTGPLGAPLAAVAFHPSEPGLLYAQPEDDQGSATLHAARLRDDGLDLLGDVAASHATSQLLPAFGGRLLVSLGEGGAESYDVTPDGATLTPADRLGSVDLLAGDLLACPDLPGVDDADGDGVEDGADNCVLVPNPDQADANAGMDDDSSRPDVQHYGDACDADLDDDGLVAPADFFGVFRPCLGADLGARPECTVADLDGDGAVAAADFFGGLRPALGSSPGPGVTGP